MKIARFNEGRIGVVVGDDLLDVTQALGIDPQQWPPVGSVQMIANWESIRPQIEACLATAPRIPVADVRLLTPVPWPNKVIAYPVNYNDHGQEMQANYRATHQGFFLKPASSLCGASDVIELPDLPGREVHHEAELGIIIGKRGRNVRREDWKDYVFGYACLMDMVVRGREERVFRKAYDSFCPVGPWITTADEVSDPANLKMKLWVNGELRQSANTKDLVLDIPGMIEMAASVMTLEPGDIIATGTPAGVGQIVDGDTVLIRIDELGEMQMKVVQGKSGKTVVFEQSYTPDIVKQPLVA
ncbi:MAG: fumarylacetoacetate hydrolase family protein [Comamonas sp.]